MGATTVVAMTITLRERNRVAAMGRVRAVAFDLMEAHGFDAVTVEQIADRSDVSPSTVYRYFGTKEALVLSARRPALVIERLADDGSERRPLDAFVRAAGKVWGGDDEVARELGLVRANAALLHAWERQLLDHRAALAEAFATRRGAASVGTRDQADAAAGLAVLMTMLIRWSATHRDRASLDKLLAKSVAALRK